MRDWFRKTTEDTGSAIALGASASVTPDYVSLPVVDLPQTMPRGKGEDEVGGGAQGEIPSVRWMDNEKVIETLRYDPSREPGQMLLGVAGGVLIGTKPKSSKRAYGEDRHLLTVAGSRAGKSVSMIVPNLLDYRGSALVTDPKAELANLTALRRARDFKQAVFVLDPFGKASDSVRQAGLLASFNPLSMLSNPDTIVEDADLIADALVIQGGNDPHWDESAKRLLQGIILHVCTFPRYGRRRNLCTVRDLLNFGVEIDERFLSHEMLARHSDDLRSGPVPKGMRGLFLEMRCNGAASAVPRAVALDMAEKPDKERDSILSSARRQTSFLDLPRMRAVLTEGTFPRTIPDLDVMKTHQGGASIYLCLPAGYMRICNRWLRLFVDLALKAMERTDQVKPEAPVLFCLDEFPVLGYMPQLEAAAGQLAGFGVRLWPIVQDLSQLKALYDERWETFIGNAAVVQFFGNSDLTTLRYMSELASKVAISVRSRRNVTAQARQAGDTGVSSSIQSFDLLPVHEARTFFDRDDEHSRQFLMYQGLAPIVASRISYLDPRAGFQRKIVQEVPEPPLPNSWDHYPGIDIADDARYEGDATSERRRFVITHQRGPQSVPMPKIHWDYFDWLASIGYDMNAYARRCSEKHPEVPLGDALQSWIYAIYEEREKEGLLRPAWMPAIRNDDGEQVK